MSFIQSFSSLEIFWVNIVEANWIFPHAQMEERLDREIKEEKAAAAAGIPWVDRSGDKSNNASSSSSSSSGNDAIDTDETAPGTQFNKNNLALHFA